MVSPGRGVVRFVRATAWAMAAFGLSTGAHVVGGGTSPSFGGALLMAIALLWTGLLITRWRLGRITLIISLAASQMLLHLILTASELSVACGTSGGHHDVVLACAGGTPVPHHSGSMMLLAHAVTTLALAVLLARGEDAVWFIANRVWPRLPAAPAHLWLTTRTIAPSHLVALRQRTILLGGVGNRGPPRWRVHVAV